MQTYWHEFANICSVLGTLVTIYTLYKVQTVATAISRTRQLVSAKLLSISTFHEVHEAIQLTMLLANATNKTNKRHFDNLSHHVKVKLNASKKTSVLNDNEVRLADTIERIVAEIFSGAPFGDQLKQKLASATVELEASVRRLTTDASEVTNG